MYRYHTAVQRSGEIKEVIDSVSIRQSGDSGKNNSRETALIDLMLAKAGGELWWY